jgi:hypothetical protein
MAHRSKLLLATCLLLVPISAQDAGQSGRAKAALAQRLKAALTKTGSQSDTAFRLQWGPNKKAKNNRKNILAQIMGQAQSRATTGSWHETHRVVAFTGAEDDELVLAGTRMLARDKQHDWRRRNGRFADGNEIRHIPDPKSLLQQLAAWPLAITHRSAGSLNDRAVEIVSVTLNSDQVSEMIWSGALPLSLTESGAINMIAIGQQFGANKQLRPAARAPEATIDLAISIDPGTNLVHSIRARAWAKDDPNGMAVFIGGNIANNGDEEEDEEEEDPDANAPLVYEDGIPKRSRKDRTVSDWDLRLMEHGQHAPTPLSDKQKQLLK